MVRTEVLDVQKIVVIALCVSFLLTFQSDQLLRIYQGRLIFIFPMHNAYHPCAYDIDWNDHGGDDADELDGVPREQVTR